MKQQEIHNFLVRYFKANQCEIVENNPAYLVIQLTVDMDKELMNRPFYWHYLEKTGGEPNPAKLTLITDSLRVPPDLKGEAVHFGSPRLHQLFGSTKKLAGFIRLYEAAATAQKQVPLMPWLCLNAKISYQCDRKKDIHVSVGLNMISGEIKENFHDQLLAKSLSAKIPDYSFTLSPLIMPASGLNRLDHHLRKTFEGDDHTWAEEAAARWEKDLNLLEHFYAEAEEKGENYENEKAALQAQYEPKIIIEVINGGLFYLAERTG